MTIDVDHIAEEVRRALAEAEEHLAILRDQRSALNLTIREQVVALEKIRKLAKAVTPRSQNGPHE
jgi:hypothetical protein